VDKLLPLMQSNTLKINNKFGSNSLKWKKRQIIETSTLEHVDEIHKGVLA
jgi:hypothetical protein